MRIDKDNIKIILILLVVCLSLGYAYINSDLNINGTAQVNHANWDIHWANIQVTNGSVTGSNVVTQPTISSGTTVNYSVILPLPGDYYEFTVDAVNGGQIDAMIDTITSKLNGATITTLPAYLKYTVTYADGTELAENQELLHNTTEKYKVRIEYNADIELNQIPATNQTLNLQFTVTYRQANEDSQEVLHPITKYTAHLADWSLPNNGSVILGSEMPDYVTQYETGAAALTALRTTMNNNNIQFYFKHIIRGGIVSESYIEFIITPEMVSANQNMTAGTYALKGGIDESSLSNKSIYEQNKAILLKAFGSDKCSSDSYSTSCSLPNIISATAYPYGTVSASYRSFGCSVSVDSSGCAAD